MKQLARWWLAGLVTVGAFSAATWICGALILPALTDNLDIRWSIAGGAGVATAALAALWGHVFAIQPQEGPMNDKHAAPAAESGEHCEMRNEVGGDVHGPVFQGRDFSGPISFGTAGATDDAEPDEPG
jgi:hypothetical protein